MIIEKYYFLFIQIIVAVVAMFAPLVQRKNLLFGVRLSKSLLKENSIKIFKKQYLKITFVFFLVWIIFSNILIIKNQSFDSIAITGEVLIMLIIYIFYNRKVRDWKDLKYSKNPELKPINPTIISDTNFRNEKLTISIKWNLIPGILLLMQFFINFTKKEFLSLNLDLLENVVPLVITNIILFGVIFWKSFMIRNVKQQISATNPTVSKEQNIIFRRRWSIFLFLMLTFMIGMNLIMNMQLLNIIMFLDFISETIYLLSVGIFVLITIIISLFMGQSGNRLKIDKDKVESKFDDIDDDVHWKAGMLYYNPQDPSLWVDKRMGIGWTLNFGNKLSWIFMAIIISIITISIMFG